jgi:two-component system response regulator VicR
MTKRLLIIDDDKDMLEMLNIVFQESDLDVVLSEKGMAADEIEVIHPDLILLDVQIKGYTRTGDEICKEIKARSGLDQVPVFLISSEPDLNLLAIECKADGFFSKPFNVSKFKSAIRDKLL